MLLKKYKYRLVKTIIPIFIFILTNIPAIIQAQSFGKNKVQYRDFKWDYIQSEHFDIYYYDQNIALVEFVADVAESCYVALKQDLRYDIQMRIPIIVYSGHNDFEQTNVSYGLIDESVGGFTELFKDRVVIPFSGSYEDFRHVIHHELTHAYMFQVFYGGGIGSMVTGMARFQMPLWLIEGLAEYESLGWDEESDMYIRDATLNGNIPPIPYMYGYMVYKGGQSLLNYIEDKYGRPKIGEILSKIRVKRNVEQGLKSAIGLDVEELSERWQKYLRKTYWPDIKDRDEPEDFAKRLTDHSKRNHFLNSSPSLSPKGDKLAFLTDRDDYMDIYLMRTIDGKELGRLVKGQRSDLFEEMHWLRPGMSWSPNGEKIVFAAKAGPQDALYLLNVENRKEIDSYKFDLDGLYSPNWSPEGNRIAFVGVKNGQSDIYIYHIENQNLDKLTDDVFSDLDPVWSPDGQKIAFISDRGDYRSDPGDNFRIQNHDYHRMNLYTIHVTTQDIQRVTNDYANEKSPVFSPQGDKLVFISDKNGISNIYIHDIKTKESYPISNLISGVSQITISSDGSRMAFASFSNGGYDIYLLNNPFEIEPGSIQLTKTEFTKIKKESIKHEIPVKEEEQTLVTTDFRNFIFDERFRKGEIESKKRIRESFLDTSDYKNEDGEYIIRKYKLRFTPDMITGEAGYSQFWGLQGTSMLALSDILGDHQFLIYTDLFYNIKNSNFQLSYLYLPKRTDIGGAIFHYSYPFYTYFYDANYIYYGYIRDRSYGLSLFTSTPFSKYRRVDFGFTGLALDRDLIAINTFYSYDEVEIGNLFRKRVFLLNLGYTTDTALWGITGPVNGSRTNFRISYSPKISQDYGLEFITARGDWRQYLRIKKDYTFVVRLAGGFSEGENPQRFLLGGMQNWINYQYEEIRDNLFQEDIFYFSSLETPLRGLKYYDMVGSRFLLTNIEFRFPLIRYLIFGWPLPLGFQNIRGVVFLDMGSAWEEDRRWQPFSKMPSGLPKLNDVKGGIGYGARLNIGFLLLRYDIGYSTNFEKTSRKPIHYFSLGAEF